MLGDFIAVTHKEGEGIEKDMSGIFLRIDVKMGKVLWYHHVQDGHL